MQKINLRLEFFLWIPVFLYAGLIFYFSSLSFLPATVEIPFIDKFEHLVEYAFFGILLTRALNNSALGLSRLNVFAWAIIIAFIYSISDEMHQVFVPGRSADLFDALFDLIGSGLGVYIYSLNKNFIKT